MDRSASKGKQVEVSGETSGGLEVPPLPFPKQEEEASGQVEVGIPCQTVSSIS